MKTGRIVRRGSGTEVATRPLVRATTLLSMLGSIGVVASLMAACSAPADPLGIARRKADAPGSPIAPNGTVTDLDASVPNPPAPDAAPLVSADASMVDAADAAVVTTQVSDLAFVEVVNGFGPAEKDMSNGEDGAADGVPLKLDGVTYAKGIGVHAASEITVPLGGQYKTFFADVGVDDEVGDNGTVVFQVLADGVPLFDSGMMTGAGPTKQVMVDVTGKTELKLVVTDAADGNGYDHADWANARLSK